ncbi:hypothetical protein TNCV_174371 [Trichonephila clavipes]|nr:hypothetical protein TNCV_174371 [Trichonephila clavipes]
MTLLKLFYFGFLETFFYGRYERHLPMISEQIFFATGKSLDCGEATSSRDQLLLDRIQSLEEQICQLSILRKSRTKERNSFRPKSRSRSRKRFDPKGKYCYFHFRFGARCKPEKCSPPCAWNRNTENFSLQ